MSSIFRRHGGIFVNKRENQIKEILINTLKENVREIQYEAKEANKDVLELCEASSSLCTTLEAIFLHGLKDSLLWQTLNLIAVDVDRRPEPSFWPPLLIFLHKQVIEQVQLLSQINTEIGQCRAWVRISLNECLISAFMKNMRENSSALRPFYKKHALVKDAEQLDIVTSIMKGLESGVGFNLPANTSLLNLWTDSSLQLSGLWSPALKSIQISSGVDIAGTISNATAVIPAPTPVQANEFFAESISNSPFTRQINLANAEKNAQKSQNLNMDEMLEKIKNIDLSDEDENTASAINKNELTFKPHDDFMPDANAPGNSLTQFMHTSWSADAQSPTTSTFRTLSNEDLTIKTSLLRSQSTSSSNSSLRAAYSKQFSYNTLLRNHENNRQVDWTEVWEKFLLQNPAQNMAARSNLSTENQEEDVMNDSDNADISNFELVSDDMDKFDVAELQKMVEQLCHLAREPGLHAQGFMCKDCQHPLGVGSKNYQVCGFSGNYYCNNCMATEAMVIPAQIVCNWDFRKYPVSKKIATFLTEFSNQPFIDLKLLNPHIYEFIDQMAELQSLRIRLNFIRAYLVTCHEKGMEELQRLFFGREYLYEHIHQYSITDLSLIKKGTLYQMLHKGWKTGEKHVLKCAVCSVKGFICEICKSSQVLYPFHINTTFRCQICGSVFHPSCLNEAQPCPKCLRMRKRQEQLQEIDENDSLT